MGISGTSNGLPPLRNGTSLVCRACSSSLTPMNASSTARPRLRYTSLLSRPPIRKYSWRRPMRAKMFAVSTR